MSHQINTNLLERAAELIDQLTGHPSGLDKALVVAVEANDLNEVHRQVFKLEAELAQEHFHNYDLLEAQV